jgi:cell division protein FtsL
VHKSKGKNNIYSLSYAEFVVPMVKAIQEQNDMIKMQDQEIDDLKSHIQKQQYKIEQLEKQFQE